MARPQDAQKGNILDIIRGRRRPKAETAAKPEELLTEADLAAIPDQYVDDDGTPILGQYTPGGVDYSATEEFKATPDDRAALGEGTSGVTGRIISRGEAPDDAAQKQQEAIDEAYEQDRFADAPWNQDTDEKITRDQAVEEAMFDWDSPSQWGGAGGYNYEYVPEGDMGYILATGPDGRTVKVTPSTKGREGKSAWASILTERFRDGEQPLNVGSPETEAPPEAEVFTPPSSATADPRSPEAFEARGAESMGYDTEPEDPYGYNPLAMFDQFTGGRYAEDSEPAPADPRSPEAFEARGAESMGYDAEAAPTSTYVQGPSQREEEFRRRQAQRARDSIFGAGGPGQQVPTP